MSRIFKVPLTPRPQTMRVNMGGTVYTLHFRYNRVMLLWVMDIYDQFDNPIAVAGGLSGIPLVTGCDLLGQFRYLGIGGGMAMIAMTVGPGHSPDETPTYKNLGTDGRVYFMVNDHAG